MKLKAKLKSLVRFLKKKRKRMQINKVKNEKKRSYNGHHRNTKDYTRLLQATICNIWLYKTDSLEEMDQFFKRYNLPSLY